MKFRRRGVSVSFMMACLIGMPATGMCAKNTVPANIHGVNYSGEEFSYWIEDPLDGRNRGGGEAVGPYSASGIRCCFSLPVHWRSGLQIKIHATHTSKTLPGAPSSDISETQIVDVPPYVDGRVGEIWVLRNADGSLSVVSSDYQPNHEKWPGKIKGWPVPSTEFQRKRWDIFVREAKNDVHLYEENLNELHLTPEAHSETAWESAKEYFPDTLLQFTGPTDIKYRQFLNDKYEKKLRRARETLARLEQQRP